MKPECDKISLAIIDQMYRYIFKRNYNSGLPFLE